MKTTVERVRLLSVRAAGLTRSSATNLASDVSHDFLARMNEYWFDFRRRSIPRPIGSMNP